MSHRRRTAAFIASGYRSHFYPTLTLARALEARGLDVVYCLTDNADGLAGEIARAGYRGEDLSQLLQLRALAKLIRRGRVWQARALLRQQIGAFAAFARRHAIDLCLVDNFLRPIAGLATINDIPAVNVCYNYSENVRVSRPLHPFEALDTATRRHPAHRPRAWPVRRWARNPGQLLDWCVGVQRDIARAAMRQGVATEYSIYNQLRVFTYPTLVCAPKELLWPQESGGLYLGLCVTDPPGGVPAGPADAGAPPLIYVSLGTLGHNFAGQQRFFSEAVKAFALQPHVRAVLQIGDRATREQLGPLPPNVEVQAYVPQRTLIARASLVITHGGLGTIKECIYAGRPMLVYPTQTEQLDNGLRVVSHGLGLLGDAFSATAADIWTRASRIMTDEGFARRVRGLHGSMQNGVAVAEGADYVTGLLAARQPVPIDRVRAAG